MKPLRLVATVALTGLCAAAAYAAGDISAAHRKKITEFMDVIGMENISRQVSMSVAKQLAFGLKQAQPDELLAFYRSPIGRKTTEAMPALMQESMELAATEAQSSVPEIKEKVTARLRKEGLVDEKP